MKFAYKFNNLLGAVFRKGNLIFSDNGNSIISPVGNRISVYDLKNHESQTLPVESKFNITALDLSPNGCLLVASNENGETFMISMMSQTVIHSYKFNREPKFIKFSPCGRFFAIGCDFMVYIFKTPGRINGQFNSFIIERIFKDDHEEKSSIDWSFDSRFLVVGSKDNSAKVRALPFFETFRNFTLSGHSDKIMFCSFLENSLDAMVISRNGQLSVWECSMNADEMVEIEKVRLDPSKKKQKESDDLEDEEDMLDDVEDNVEVTESGRDKQGKLVVVKEDKKSFFYKRTQRHYLMDEMKKETRNCTLTAAHFHKKLKLLVTAYSTGAFYLHELDDMSLIHSLKISENAIDAITFNNTGDWICLGSSGAGQLLVWEWQSEQYIMKQQGHNDNMTSVSYSSDGNYIITGGFDGKIKIWNVHSGFCTVTFSEHTSGVTGIDFSKKKKFFVSSSVDGTVRAFDMVRYRNFKTLTAPRLVQFSCVAVDYSGDLVAAGAQDVFDIHLWSLKFGNLLEIISGHEGPVMSMNFSPAPDSSMLVSGGWDNSVRIWNCLDRSSENEPIDLLSNIVAVTFKPNGDEVAVATLSCVISFFDAKSNQQITSIECRNDVGLSVSEEDTVSSKTLACTKYFTSIVYSPDGECILAGGKSKFVCIYHIREGILLKKFEITQNMSLSGMNEYINRRNITEFGNIALIEERDKLEGGNVKIKLPGTSKNDVASRNFKPEVGVSSLSFSPNGQQWTAASSEGLMVYSLNTGIVFDPYQMSIEATPKTVRKLTEDHEHASALVMALKINETQLIQETIENIPFHDIDLTLDSISDNFISKTLEFTSKMLWTHHIEFYLKWTCSCLRKLGSKNETLDSQVLVTIQQNLAKKYNTLNKLCDFNKYMIQISKTMSKTKIREDMEDDAELIEYEDHDDSSEE